MDESKQQQIGSDIVPGDCDCDTSFKGTVDEKTPENFARRSSCDTPNSDTAIQALNANGIDKEFEALTSDNFSKCDLESKQSQESAVQEENISNDNLHEPNIELNADSEDFSASLKEFNDKASEEITFSSRDGEKSNFSLGNCNKSDVNVSQASDEENAYSKVKTSIIPETQSIEDIKFDKELNISDLSEKNELHEIYGTTRNNEGNSSQEETSGSQKHSEDECSISNQESSNLNSKISPVNISKNKTNDISLDEEGTPIITDVISNVSTETVREEADGSQEVCGSDVQISIDGVNSKVTADDQQNEKKKESVEEKPSPNASLEEEDCLGDGSEEKAKEKINAVQLEAESNVPENGEGIPETISDEMNSHNEVTNIEEEKKPDEAEECENSQKQLDIASLESERAKSGEPDEFESSQKHFATDSVESEKEASELGDKNSVQEYSQTSLNRLNTNTEQEEEENLNKSENEGNDVMDTEMVNYNEIEQIDLSENENDLKGESRDEELVADLLETGGEKGNEDHIGDGRDDSGETNKSAMLIDEEGVNQPGNSEEETITGDTTNQSSTDLAKEKDEEICIIPDDVVPNLSILPQNKDVEPREGENEGLTVLKVTSTESLKQRTRSHGRKSQIDDSKSRPVRNAAKLAGNKIKSLVESDLVCDEQGLSGNLEGENDFQENTDESAQMCAQCREVKVCKLLSVQNDTTQYLCSEQCSVAYKAAQMDIESPETENTVREFIRKCGQCHSQITIDENRLFWETVDFCNEDCLGKYQLELGSHCANCKKSVPSTSLGKYCVRFGYDIKQFCSALCLEEYKKGLKVCSYCQKDISTGTEGFLAPVGNKGQFKDFCTQSCMEKYDRMSSNKPLPEIIEECAVCSNSKPVQVEVELDNKTHKLCSEPCFAAFKFVNNITEGQCEMCRKYFDRTKTPNYSLRLLFYDETLHSFCSKTCMNVYILANRKIVPCNWCKVKKYNFDMIKKVSPDGQLSMMCSLNCLMLYQTSVNAVCSRPIKCDYCKKKFVRQPLYHLTMSDATLRNFCSYNCVMSFQNGYPKQSVISEQLSTPIPTGGPKRLAPNRSQVESTCVPVISSVQSLASPNGPVSPTGRVQIPRGDVLPQVSQPLSIPASPLPAPPPQVYQQIITKPAPAKQMKNKSVLCKPYSHTKGVSCRPHPCMKETQTDQSLNRKFLIPIPVPIYVPAPMHMFATPFPVPVPFPLPVPVPIFIPTTRNSAKGIMKEIKKIQEKIPTDPFEAELLMMAEMVAGDKKQDPTDSESEEGNDGDENGDGTFSPENVDTSNTFGDDMLQMALKMASELEEPAVDMESVLTSNTITTSTQPAVDPNKALYASDTDDPDQVNVMAMNRGRKRSIRGSRSSSGGTPTKRGRRTSGSVDVPLLPPPEPVPPRTIEVEKPDANMCLKYTFGVNAWRHWVMQKNAELEKAALTNRKIKLFKPELLQLTADELNFSLCLFVKEVRKPNGTEYAPDTIYYLCLGIQQYLFENGRIDNIFTDSYYEKFTDCLDEVAKKFAALYNDSQYIVTRVEEEHLWESKQLGAHSPHVLLSTLMFFNTKHFNLVTVEEHMQLSFSHIMKHWKRNPNTPGVAKVPGSRNVLLRFYPPQSALEANSRKKKVYEQQENEENPLRCPVKLYEFYLSKCPESVKTRNDVFYLLPERSCVPDSPVWYSTMALGKEPLMKMLHRIKMVKEINIALLTS